MNFIDKLITVFNPEKGLKRFQARRKLEILNTGYSNHGASTTKKSMLGWQSAGGGVKKDIYKNRKKLIERSRDLYMGTSVATGALKTINTNVVGSGLKLKAAIDSETIGISDDEATKVEELIEKEFELWSKDKIDNLGTMNFYQVQELVFLTVLLNGECFIKLNYFETPKNPYSLKLEILEPDRIYTPNNMLSNKHFKITPRIGEYYLLDKIQGYLTDSVIFQCPTEMGKGILVSKTAHGNIIVGPTASDVENKDDVGNTQEGLDTVRQFATKSIKDINFRDNIRNFAGLRAEADTGDFILGEAEDVKGFFNMAGTKSPGLTSAPAMAVDLAKMVVESLGGVKKKENFIKNRKMVHFINLSPEEKAEVIKKDPRYGRIICRCENITEGEIVDAIHRKCGGRTLNGIKRRVRPGAGRCQGGFCGPRVQEILARELGEDLEEIVMEQKDSYILTGKTK